jgi:hypothetical protein
LTANFNLMQLDKFVSLQIIAFKTIFMKFRFTALVFVFAFFTISSAQAQLSSLGLDRRIGGSGQFQPSKNKTKDKDFDYVKASADNMTKELALDGFQSAAVKNFIQDYYNSIVSINAEEIPDEGKMEKMNKEKEKMEAKIISVLNKVQIEKFNAMKEKMEKKGKKKKKKSSEDE